VTTRFLGLDFRPVRLEDKAVLQALLRRFPQRISGYTFASLVAWAGPYGFEWARMGDDCVLVRRPYGDRGEMHLLQPLGAMDPACCATLLREAERLPYPLMLLSVAREFVAAHAGLCGRFSAVEDRAGANYIYLASDLASLPGRRYAKKRNLIAQFVDRHPRWEATPLDVRCGRDCQDVLLAMARGLGLPTDDPSLRAELAALDFTIRHLHALEQDGLVIRVEGRPAAFSVFERLDAEVSAVHFEKADRAYKGIFQVVNREAARRMQASGARLINREEDVGDEGLRQAKLSYHPIEILPVYDITLVRDGAGDAVSVVSEADADR
jgi:hypothetical protein